MTSQTPAPDAWSPLGDSTELLWRQVPAALIDQGRLKNEAFLATTKDEGWASVARSAVVSDTEAQVRHLARGGKSSAVAAVSVAEVWSISAGAAANFGAFDDSIEQGRPEEHACLGNFRMLERRQKKTVGDLLARAARLRGLTCIRAEIA